MGSTAESCDMSDTTHNAFEFDAVYRNWWLTVYVGAAELVECAHDAEDAAQRVFARLWASGGWRQIENPKHFFRRAGRNEAVTILRERERLRVRPLDRRLARFLPAPDRSPEGAALATVAREEAMRLIALLPQRCRAVCTLVFLQNLTHAEAAGVLGITVRAVDKQIARARRRIRAIVGSEVHVSSFLDGGGECVCASLVMKMATATVQHGFEVELTDEASAAPLGLPTI